MIRIDLLFVIKQIMRHIRYKSNYIKYTKVKIIKFKKMTCIFPRLSCNIILSKVQCWNCLNNSASNILAPFPSFLPGSRVYSNAAIGFVGQPKYENFRITAKNGQPKISVTARRSILSLADAVALFQNMGKSDRNTQHCFKGLPK